MKSRSIFRDSSFWSLAIINIAIIVYYYYNQTGFKTLIWIYWCQSVLIGFFTFLDLATVKNIEPISMTINGEPVKDPKQAQGCLAPFFAVHFGIFHLVYFFFLFTITSSKEVFDWRLFEFSVGAFALDQLWNFFRTKQWERTHAANPGTIFFLPYARIVPMHFTILIPAFFGFIPRLGIFLVLKMLMDLLMYAITLKVYGRPVFEDPTELRTIK